VGSEPTTPGSRVRDSSPEPTTRGLQWPRAGLGHGEALDQASPDSLPEKQQIISRGPVPASGPDCQSLLLKVGKEGLHRGPLAGARRASLSKAVWTDEVIVEVRSLHFLHLSAANVAQILHEQAAAGAITAPRSGGEVSESRVRLQVVKEAIPQAVVIANCPFAVAGPWRMPDADLRHRPPGSSPVN